MIILSDILLYISTSLVFSIACLCILLQLKAKDKYSASFLTVLIPLALQMGLNSIVTYIFRTSAYENFSLNTYSMFSLAVTLTSIFLTTFLLYSISRYFLTLLPLEKKMRKLANVVIYLLLLIFIIASLFFIIFRSKGDWVNAMEVTINYHFSTGSFLYIAHGIATLFYIKKARNREEESLLKGISITFLPLAILFPLDMIFFRNHAFKLSYICFSIFTVNTYTFISRFYFRSYEPKPEAIEIKEGFLFKHGLSEREIEIARLLVRGQTNKEISEILYISVNTVKTHIKNIYKKLSVSNRIQLIYLLQTNSQ